MMKNKLLSLIVTLSFLLILFPSPNVAAIEGVTVTINNASVTFNKSSGSPFIDRNGRTQVPLRASMEALGATVGWNNYDRAASVTKNGITVIVPIGKNYVFINGVKKWNDTAAQMINSKTFLPIRIVAESLGANVEWIEATQTVAITGSTENKPIYFSQLSSWIGKPLAASYTILGYNSIPAWSLMADGPAVEFKDLGLFFDIAGENLWVDDSTFLNPNNTITAVTSTGQYPVLDNIIGTMTIDELTHLTNDKIQLEFMSEEESEKYDHYYTTLTTNDNLYRLTFVWIRSTYPEHNTPSTYVCLYLN